MSTINCPECGAEMDYTDDEGGQCFECFSKLEPEHERERLDDDGRDYSDPRDYRDGLED